MLRVSALLCAAAVLLLTGTASGQTTQAANWSTPAAFNVRTPSAAAIARLNSYDQFVTIVLDGHSFDSLFGAYPGANGIPKGLLDYRPQTDIFGSPLATLPLCSLGTQAACGFPADLPNTYFEASQYVPTDATSPFTATQGYYNERFQLHNGHEDRFASPTVDGFPVVSNAGGWALAWYNLTGSYLFGLASEFTVLDNHFHPSFGSAFANHQYLISGHLPYFNNSADGCATQGWTTAVDHLGSAYFANNTLHRCTADGRITESIFPASYPAEVYSINSSLVSDFVVGPFPEDAVAGSPLLADVTPAITGYTHLGDELDLLDVSWSWYAQGYQYVSSSPVNFTAADALGFAWELQPLLYFPNFADLSSSYAQAHQQDDSAFFTNLAAGTLESVTFLKPASSNSFASSTSSIESGEAYLATVMEAIFASPQYQAGTMLVHITFSNNGGEADHGSVYKGDVDGPGVRVPGLLISPDHAGGRINSFPYDEMAYIEMIERRFSVTSSVLNTTRSAVTRDLTNTFDDATRNATLDFTPLHVRTAYGGPNAMVVSWDVADAYLPTGASALVVWGTDPSSLTNVAVANSTTYYSSAVVMHHARITGLAFHTTYYFTLPYQTSSTPYSFTTARFAGDGSADQLIGLVGDLGLMPTADNTVLRLSNLTIAGALDFIMHVGDISYADTWADSEPVAPARSYDQIWDQFMAQVAPVLETATYMVLPGNHEADCEHNGPSQCVVLQNNFTSYDRRWRMPGDASAGYRSMWYSFDQGLIHWTIYNTETDFSNAPDQISSGLNAGPFAPAGTQLAWLEADLAAANANRANVPFLIVAGHRPWIVLDPSDACVACGAAFHNILVKYNPDLALFGHVHRYERSYPLSTNMTIVSNETSYISADTAGTVFVVMGNAGNVEGHSTELAKNNSWTYAFDDAHYGYATLAVHASNKSLTYTMHNADDNSVMDSFTIAAKSAAVVGLPGAAIGDPQLKGFLGQSFQVHGLDGGVYSVLSEKEMQVNARFTFLEAGRCPPSHIETPCWSHPGSYFGALSIRTLSGARMLVQAGNATSGFALVELDGEPLSLAQPASVSSTDSSIATRITNAWQLEVTVGLYSIQLHNSDLFINLASVRVSDWSKLVREVQPHGLLGQTWRRQRAGLDVAEVEGRVDDYLEANNDLMGNQFMYNLFQQ